jgi:hypothetical protein
MRQLATEYNSPVPVIDLAHQHMRTSRAIQQQRVAEGTQKFDILDWSSLVSSLRLGAGLTPDGQRVRCRVLTLMYAS